MQPSRNKRWVIAPPIPPEVDSALMEYPAIIRQVLYNRLGATDSRGAAAYLRAESEGGDPFDMLGMRAAVERLLWSVDHHEAIAIYGDYDVDGVTATTLMVEVLGCLGADVRWYIPNRFDEGYGLNNDALDYLKGSGVELVLTVDCGIRSVEEATHARDLHIDLIISDHHHPGSEQPEAVAVICPKQAGDLYPDKDLSGVGLAYKIAQGLLKMRPNSGCLAEDWLDLVALGTISDIVPLRGENRILVRRGLEQLRKGTRQGVVSLAGAAGVKLPGLSSMDVGFMLGPRLNAAGRLESAEAALNLMLTRDIFQAGDLAQKLDNQNRERQAKTREMQEQAAQALSTSEDENIIFAFSPDFNPGVVGLVAARLVDTFYRPAIVGQVEGETTRASCRSIPEFHITQALDECKHLLVRHGGHQAAAGFTILNKDLPELQDRLRAIAGRVLGGQELIPTMRADVEVAARDLQPNLLKYLDLLQPTGQDNPEATFVTRGMRVMYRRTVGGDGQHLKMKVNGNGVTWDAIAFRQGHQAETLPEWVDLLYTFERNVYNGMVTLQLNVRDLKPSQ